ncbi:hypothetical protein BC830DRAFT_1170423 [Chytriomyces sp. MP71]|nr:hypothetical protein BC830DRAFT_1170423 [Chytriomyces sp. MP71]
MIATREEIASSLKHLSPSAKEWVSLVTRQTVREKDREHRDRDREGKGRARGSAQATSAATTAATGKGSWSGEWTEKENSSRKGRADSGASPGPDAAAAVVVSTSEPSKASKPGERRTEDETDECEEDFEEAFEDGDDDSEHEVNDLVRFVFEQDATNPWDERLFKWVMGSFDKYGAFIESEAAGLPAPADDPVATAAALEASVKAIILSNPDWPDVAAVVSAFSLESGGRIALSPAFKDTLTSALRVVSAPGAAMQPKITNAAICLEIQSLDAAVKQEQDRFSARIKAICEPYLCLTVKSMNALFDFDDIISERYLNLSIGKLLKKKLDKFGAIYSFEDYWTDATSKLSVPSKFKGKKSSLLVDAKAVDGLWDHYLNTVSGAAGVCHDLIANDSVNEIIAAAEQLRTVLVASLDEMVSQCKTVTEPANEVVWGTKENLTEFKEFLRTESALFKETSTAARESLGALIADLNNLYHLNSSSSQPTMRGRLERTRNRDFTKRVKAFEAEQANYRAKLISDLEEFAGSIQWDCLVLGVEVIGACLDICDDDLEIEHSLVRDDWLNQISGSSIFEKRERTLAMYKEGVKFGLFEYVKAVGSLLLNVAGGDSSFSVPPVLQNPSTASNPSATTANSSSMKKKKNKKKKKKASRMVKDLSVVAENVEKMNESDAEESEEEDVDAAIPPQYVQKRASDIPTAEDVPPMTPPGSTALETHIADPFANITTNSVVANTDAASSEIGACESSSAGPGPSARAILPPMEEAPIPLYHKTAGNDQGLVLTSPSSMQDNGYEISSSAPPSTQDSAEVNKFKVLYTNATHDIAKLQSDCRMFLHEIHRLNAEVAHWKSLAEHLHLQQQQYHQQQLAGGREFFVPPSAQASLVRPMPLQASPQQQEPIRHQQNSSIDISSSIFDGSFLGGLAKTGGESLVPVSSVHQTKHSPLPADAWEKSAKDSLSSARVNAESSGFMPDTGAY